MDSIKVAENLAAGSVVKEVQIILENGGEANYSIALVSGKFAIDNAKFSFDVDGNIINNNILASGIYWIRYRATVGFNSVEKGLKIYTDDQEVEITLSSTSYDSSIAASEVVSTVSLSAGSTSDVTITPQSDEDDSGLPAFNYDGPSGEIRWSGNQSPLDYTYNIQYTGECIKPILNQLFTVIELIDLDSALCSSPGSGIENSNHEIETEAVASGTNNFTAARADLNDINGAFVHNPTNPNPFWVSNQAGNTALERAARRFDFTGGTSSLSLNTQAINWRGAVGEKIVIVYTSGDIETGRANPLYDMPSWTVLGTIDVTGTYDISGLVPAIADVWIGFMWERDYTGDFGVYDVATVITADIATGNTYRCP